MPATSAMNRPSSSPSMQMPAYLFTAGEDGHNDCARICQGDSAAGLDGNSLEPHWAAAIEAATD